MLNAFLNAHQQARITLETPGAFKGFIGLAQETLGLVRATLSASNWINWENGGWYRDRTCDPYHVKVKVSRETIDISQEIIQETAKSEGKSESFLGINWAKSPISPLEA